MYQVTADSLSMLNINFFPAGQLQQEQESLEEEISRRREELLTKIAALEKIKTRKKPNIVSEEALETFYRKHPSMRIHVDGNDIQLISEWQPLYFHTDRGHNRYDQNSDIVYATLPLYGYKIIFSPDNRVSICCNGSTTTGHPHAIAGPHGMFESVCYGNNRFADARLKDGNTFMRVMHQAATWLESANLSDMYDTAARPAVDLSAHGDLQAFADSLLTAAYGNDQSKVNALIHGRAARFAEALQCYDSFRWVQRFAWTLWMYAHWHDFADIRYMHRTSLYAALTNDLEKMLDMPPRSESNDMDIALRCPKEFAGYMDMEEMFPVLKGVL